jgi:type IV pilus assembly protein PilM
VALAPGLVTDGEVAEPEALGAELKRLFAGAGLARRVRAGVASQRTLMRTIDLPPLDDEDDVASAVRIHAPEHIAMPLDQALVDHRSLGRVETPEGPRTRVVVAATDREPVERLVAALRRAGLRVEGVDLSAFALIRALHDPSPAAEGPVLYAHVGAATTLAIADAGVCRFTRVAPVGLHSMAAQLAERTGVDPEQARAALLAAGRAGAPEHPELRSVLDAGLAELGDDLRTSVEFFATQWEALVREVVVTGPGLELPGLASALEARVGLPVRPAAVRVAPGARLADLAPGRLAVAAGLAVAEVTR